MDEPADKRMRGMVWEWGGDSLMLTREALGKTGDPPTGATYLGCQLFFLDSGGMNQ